VAYTLSPNQAPATYGEALWMLKEALVASFDWVVFGSGDGVGGVNLGGDVLDAGGPYAGSLDNTGAWYRIRCTNSTPGREFLVHNDSATNGRVTILYSSDDIGFTGGAPTTSVRPTAADEQVIAANTANFFLNGGDGTVYVDVLVGSTAENFSWFFGARSRSTFEAGYSTVLFLDVVQDGSSLDPDPAVVGCVFDSDSGAVFANISSNPIDIGYVTSTTNIGSCRGWYDKGVTDLWVNYPITMISGEAGGGHQFRALVGSGAGVNLAGEVEENPVWYWRGTGATQVGKKGRSTLFLTSHSSIGFMRPEGGSTPFARMSLGLVSIPWDGLTRPVV